MPPLRPPTIQISARVQALLEQVARQRSTEYRLVSRARLILGMATGANNQELARTHDLDRSTVRAWRTRWLELMPRLSVAEAAPESEAQLRSLPDVGLADLPRSGTPATFRAEQIVRIVAVACEDPAACGLPVSHWTPEAVAAEVVKRGIVPSISPSSVGRFLKSGGLKTAPD